MTAGRVSGSISRHALLAIAAMAAAGLASAHHCAGGSAEAADEGTAVALLQQRCVLCHAKTTVSDRRATPEGWQEIITRMVSYGAQLSEDEARTIVDYLATHNGPEATR